ncbi:unnamed protein product [Mycena citricolor]|uniref:Uncharacterized protein n=1 Tax=Mycena citricolor TaxID=2018698 RepID=A0AAD2H3K8_9AGAR|nr:unnamed protein product [Mycena citricolor]CAK5269140.1 unnamed protein product [Mycena citricolor]
MAGKAKSKAKGVSASSFLDLKAELSKQTDEFTRNKAGTAGYVVGGVKRPDKKPTVWTRQNHGVSKRAARDLEMEKVSQPTLESARSALERKAKIYEKLKKGKHGGLSDKQYENLLVDFDSKPGDHFFESDSDDLDESVALARPPPDEDDPIVEYEDEFGRLRTARRSEVPRELLNPEPQVDEDEDLVIHNPVGHFPVYRPSAERVAQIEKEHAEENNPLGAHYDASGENRAKGAGFYQFSKDEETRKAQMDELKASREETLNTRKETGAIDVLPGDIEGMREGPPSGQSRAMEKRKRDLEERRKLLDAKRRKLTATSTPSQTTKPTSVEAVTPPVDPFAALEQSAQSSGKSAADQFLAELEQDFMKQQRR